MSDGGLGRDISEDERRLWRRVKQAHANTEMTTVQAVQIGNDIGLHETRTRQIVRTWDNDGLVNAFDNANLCVLTTMGRAFEM